MIAISNATPLINLSAIGLFNLLHNLFETVIIPDAVYAEVVVEGRGRSGAAEVSAATWIMRKTVADRAGVNQLMTGIGLGAGESEVIALFSEVEADALLLDDLAARRYAINNHPPVLGTVGILLSAKSKKLIASVKESMDALRAANKYIHDDVYYEALRRAGE